MDMGRIGVEATEDVSHPHHPSSVDFLDQSSAGLSALIGLQLLIFRDVSAHGPVCTELPALWGIYTYSANCA
jgi:hypothetical protein